jgi:uncharacterized Zn finger protein
MSALVFPRQPHRRASRKLRSWWGRAFWRAVEELAYDETQLLHARSLARSGRIGGLVVDTGTFAAGVVEEAGIWTVTGVVPPLDEDGRTAFLEVVGGRADALLAGELPHELVEHAEEAGVELVPYGVELGATCSCPNWQRASRHGGVCEHAIAILAQVADLLDGDPLVLLQLRGIGRADLLPRRAPEPGPAHRDEGPDEVEIALDAAVRAARLLAEVESCPESCPGSSPEVSPETSRGA